MFPRKRFGQHFLQDAGIIARIVDSVTLKPGERLVEIGPGLGAITWSLLHRFKQLDAIEIDRDAIAHLRAKSTELGFADALRIYEGDALQFDLADISAAPRSIHVIGNLPYNISTPLLFHLLKARAQIVDMHFMLQKEVVDRMAASPGDDAYGRLTVMLAPWVQVQALFDIGPQAFRPPPKVMSTFFRLTPHATPPFIVEHPDEYARIVSAAFSQRRKTLRNALKTLLTAAAITAADVDPTLRAEVITPSQYSALARQLAATASTSADL